MTMTDRVLYFILKWGILTGFWGMMMWGFLRELDR